VRHNQKVFKLLKNKEWREIVLSPEPDFALIPRITYYWTLGSFREAKWRVVFRKLTENRPNVGNELCWFDDSGGECYKISYAVASKDQRRRFSVFQAGKTRNVFHIRKLWGLRVKCWKGPGELPSTEFSLLIWGQDLLDTVRSIGISKLFETETYHVAEASNCEEARKLHQLKCTILQHSSPYSGLAIHNQQQQQQQPQPQLQSQKVLSTNSG